MRPLDDRDQLDNLHLDPLSQDMMGVQPIPRAFGSTDAAKFDTPSKQAKTLFVAEDSTGALIHDQVLSTVEGNEVIDEGAGTNAVRGSTLLSIARDVDEQPSDASLAGELSANSLDATSSESTSNAPDMRVQNRTLETDDIPSVQSNTRLSGPVANDNPVQPISPVVNAPQVPRDSSQELVGGWNDDVLTGGSGDDRLLGNGGNDTLEGQDGDDYAFGATGDDLILGGNGSDELRGGLDNDVILGGNGDDYLNGWNGNDTLNGGDGNDVMEGGIGADTYVFSVDALGDQDVIRDSGGNDLLDFDTLDPFVHIASVSQIGSDLVFTYHDGGSLTVQGFYGTGEIEALRFDDAQYATNADASSPISFSDFVAGTQDLILAGGDSDDVLLGEDGNDRLIGGLGSDTLEGREGNDEIIGGDGNDFLSGGAGNDVLIGGDAFDALGADQLDGGAGDDQLFGGNGNDVLLGGDGHDRLLGEAGNDIGEGGSGNDYLFGDTGNDKLSGGDGADEVRGGIGNDILFGNSGDDFVHGYFGNDWLNGGTGTDRLEGGSGRDTFEMRRGNGSDTIVDFTLFSAGAFFADKINLQDFGLAGFDDLVMSDIAGDTLINLGNGDELTLENVQSSDLSADDFSF